MKIINLKQQENDADCSFSSRSTELSLKDEDEIYNTASSIEKLTNQDQNFNNQDDSYLNYIALDLKSKLPNKEITKIQDNAKDIYECQVQYTKNINEKKFRNTVDYQDIDEETYEYKINYKENDYCGSIR